MRLLRHLYSYVSAALIAHLISAPVPEAAERRLQKDTGPPAFR